jgi:hypothetical protein
VSYYRSVNCNCVLVTAWMPGRDMTHCNEYKLITVLYVIVKVGKTRGGGIVINLWAGHCLMSVLQFDINLRLEVVDISALALNTVLPT